jgi:hypothetical protein
MGLIDSERPSLFVRGVRPTMPIGMYVAHVSWDFRRQDVRRREFRLLTL